MARSAASYILMLDEQSSQAQNMLHKNAFSDLARRSKAKTAEALFPSSFHYAATSRSSSTIWSSSRLHFITPRQAISFSYEAFAPLIWWGNKKWEFLLAINTFFWTLSIQSFMAGFFYILILPTEPQAFTANHLPNREQIPQRSPYYFRLSRRGGFTHLWRVI